MERLALFAIFAAICLLTVAGGAIALAQDATGGRFAAAAVLAAVCGGAVCVVLMVGSARRPDRSSGRGWILAVAAAGGAGSLLSALTGLWEAIILGFMGGFALTWVPVLAYLAMRRRSGDWRQRSSEAVKDDR